MKAKTLGKKIKELFQKRYEDQEFFDNLEDLLIESDIGVNIAMDAIDTLRDRVKKEKLESKDEIEQCLKDFLSEYILTEPLDFSKDTLNIGLVLGVNGVGKTTTIAKLARYYQKNKSFSDIILSAGDTFRAGAINQLKYHGEKLGLNTISQPEGADPGAVIFDSLESISHKGDGLVLADTAGRMHNKANLINQLTKIDRIVKRKINGGVYKKVLIIDATTGQNGLRQAEIFHDAIGVDSVVLAKYDSTARGGIVLSISKNLGLPFSFLGIGEKYENLIPFNKKEYLDFLLNEA